MCLQGGQQRSVWAGLQHNGVGAMAAPASQASVGSKETLHDDLFSIAVTHVVEVVSFDVEAIWKR
jgi:hypothetical protein